MLPTMASLSRISLVTTRSSLREVLAQILDELARAVRALDLAVGEHVHARQELLLQELDARERVVHRPVVAVGEVERVDVPLVRRVVVVDDLRRTACRRSRSSCRRDSRVWKNVSRSTSRATASWMM